MRSEVWLSRDAARNRSLGRPGAPPARQYDLAARSSLHGFRRIIPETEARPPAKNRHGGSAERRARRSQDARRASQARQRMCASRRSATPRLGGLPAEASAKAGKATTDLKAWAPVRRGNAPPSPRLWRVYSSARRSFSGGGERILFDMRESDRERQAAEQQAAADFLGLAHDTVGLWRPCTNKACRRIRACLGDTDACGARRFPEVWAWVHGILRALRDGARPSAAMRGATRRVIVMDKDGAFGPRARTVVVHFPGLGESYKMIIPPEAAKGRRSPSVGSITSRRNMRSAPTTIRHIDDR
jgi:hypothetical protein